jgi:long-chain fatty acid transport protein
MTLEGDITSDLAPTLNDSGTVDLDLPAITEIGIHHEINSRLSVQAGAVYTEWSSFEVLEAKLDSQDEPLHLKDEYWNNSWRLSAGVTYKPSEEWTVRAGYAYDETPVDAEHRTTSIPDTDRQWFTLGGTYQWDTNTTIDMGYAYITGRSVDINEEFEIPVPGIELPFSNFEGELKTADAHVLAVQMNYSF